MRELVKNEQLITIVPQDFKKAFDLFQEASDAGLVEAKTFLAFLYDSGKGVEQDKQKAFDLYQEASDAGDVTAKINLGAMYYNGDGVPQSYDKAFDLFSANEHINSEILQFYLGNMYYFGYGVEPNVEKAKKHYQNAAALGSLKAHYFLGHIYQKEGGPEAEKYYLYCAYNGDADAMFNLAALYVDGTAGGIQKEKAHAWFTKANDNGMPAAKKALGKLEENMGFMEISRAKAYLVEIEKVSPASVPSPVPKTVLASMVKKPSSILGDALLPISGRLNVSAAPRKSSSKSSISSSASSSSVAPRDRERRRLRRR